MNSGLLLATVQLHPLGAVTLTEPGPEGVAAKDWMVAESEKKQEPAGTIVTV